MPLRWFRAPSASFRVKFRVRSSLSALAVHSIVTTTRPSRPGSSPPQATFDMDRTIV